MNKKKLLSVLLTLALTLSLASPALAAAFPDVSADSWYATAVQYVSDEKVMTGTDKGFEPDAQLTRGQVVKILYNVAGAPTEGMEKAAFNDIEGTWYADAAHWAGFVGIAAGKDDGSFGGDEVITRAETADLLAGYAATAGYLAEEGGMAMQEAPDYAEIPAEYLSGMSFCYYAGVMKGNQEGKLLPAGQLTRAEMAQIMYNFGQVKPTYTTEKVMIAVPQQDGIPAHDIPAVVTLPADSEGTYPGVVMLHGTGSNKDEAGNGYAIAAPILAAEGFASIRLDFMGNGDSMADYVNYNYTSATLDAKAAADYLAKLDQVDGDKLAVLGWSQGGTNAILAAAAHPDTFKAVVTWAGALDLSVMFADFKAAKAEADKNGHFTMNFDWREPLNIGAQWFEEVSSTDMLKEVAKLEAPILALNGGKDDVVLPENAQKIADAAKNPRSYPVIIEDCDHTYNVFTGDLSALNTAIAESAIFMYGVLEADAMMVPVSVTNGERQVPAIVTLPKGEGPFAAVVMNHGHGGSKDENVGFPGVAAALAEQGIASIRMDFPGCGESMRPFTENTMTNMISDSNACKEYLVKNFPVDAGKLGILGYSMGGRIALTIAGEKGNTYKAVGLLAPAAGPGAEMIEGLVGGKEVYEAAYATATKDGFFTFTTQFGQEQQLSKAWFDDMKASAPLKTIQSYTGPMLVIYGDQDVVVDETVNKLVLEAYPKAQGIVVKDADHGYGFYSDQPDVTATVEGNLAAFFAKALLNKTVELPAA